MNGWSQPLNISLGGADSIDCNHENIMDEEWSETFAQESLNNLKEAWRQKYRDKVAELVTQYNTGDQN